MFDLNLDGKIDSNDVSLATSLAGTAWAAPIDTDLATYQLSYASSISSQNTQNVNANAFDNNLNTTWESARPTNGNASSGVAGVDPGWIYVDLGAPATVDGFTIYWDNAAASSYQVLRGLATGGESTSIATTTGTSTVDSTVASGTQYFYKVMASNAGTVTTTSNEQSITTQTPPPANGNVSTGTPIYQINAGSGGAAGNFVGDEFFTGGGTSNTSSQITVPAGDSASQAVYQSNRYGNFSYSFPPLAKNGTYTLVLHFAETYSGSAGVGERVFNVLVNGNAVSCPVASGGSTNCLNSIDIYKQAGFDAGLILSAPVTADANGNLVLTFKTITDNAQVNGIELLTNNSALPAPAAPLNLKVQAGNKQNTLSWNPGSGPTGTDTIYRGTAQGQETTLLPNATNIMAMYYVDNQSAAAQNPQNGTTYFYKVVSSNSAGSNYTEGSAITGLPVPGTAIVRMAAGSTTSIPDPTIGQAFTPDTFGKSGASTNGNTINIAGVVQAAPTAVYQNEHSSSSFSYTFNNASGLKPNTAVTVRLHFAETYFPAAGNRAFNVSCNSFQLSNFDIFAASGGKNIAIIEQFTTTTDANGSITINFTTGSANQPKVDGIESTSRDFNRLEQ